MPPSSVEDHLARILDDTAAFEAQRLPLLDALGLAAAELVVSPLSLPRFDNSGMDGYAVVTADIEGASEESPVALPVIGEIGAGQGGVARIASGQTAKIMTGAPVPEGADAVVPYEWTDAGTATVLINQAPSVGQHLRPIGQDLVAGAVLVRPGDVLGPRQLGLLASVGFADVSVRRRPRVAILSTGSELRAPGDELGADSIYDGNSYLLAAAATRAGAVVDRVGIVPDDPDLFVATLEKVLATADAVVTSGGVSMGDFDIVKATLRERGVWFGPVAMQPGKPQGYGRVNGTQVFTLPGNPVSSYISFELFVRPALRTMMGIAPASRTTVTARITEAVTSPPERRQFLRGVVRMVDGERVVDPMVMPGSHLVGDLATANALIVLLEPVTALAAGDEVGVIMLDEEN